MMAINNSNITSRDFIQRLAEVNNDDPCRVRVKVTSRNAKSVRFVTHWEHTDEDIELAITKILYVINEFDSKLKSKL